MVAKTEGDMGIRLTFQIDVVGIRKNLGIPVGRRLGERDAPLRLNLESVHFTPGRADALRPDSD